MSELYSKPDWLDEHFFNKIFQDELRIPSTKFHLTIKSVKPIQGHSSLLRIQVNLLKLNDDKPMEYSLIVKYLCDSYDEKFTREIAMYEEILPALEYEWKVRNEKITFGPKLYGTSNDPVKHLVIDDIITDGNFTQYLDIDHSKVLLNKLAKYHASTAVYYDKYKSYGETFDVDYTKRKFELEFNKIWTHDFPKFINVFETHESLKPYSSKIANFKNTPGDQLYKNAIKINESSLNVLNHGDCKASNFVFLYNEQNQVIDVSLIDFQESIFNSPVYDLLYFLITSASNDLFNSGHIDGLIEFYHTNLVIYLEKLNYRMYVISLDELNMELRKRSFWGLYITVRSSSSILLETDQVGESDIQRLETVCKWFETKKMLDICK